MIKNMRRVKVIDMFGRYNERSYESRYVTLFCLIVSLVWNITLMTMVAKSMIGFIEVVKPMYQDLVEISETLTTASDILVDE